MPDDETPPPTSSQKVPENEFLYLPTSARSAAAPAAPAAVTPDTTSPTPPSDRDMFHLPPPKIPGFTPTSLQEGETGYEKIKRKTGENPFVPAGALLTAGVLCVGLWTMKTKNRSLSQKMMRARVAAQGATIAALVGGMMWQNRDTDSDQN